jgi:hypothetical protein
MVVVTLPTLMLTRSLPSSGVSVYCIGLPALKSSNLAYASYIRGLEVVVFKARLEIKCLQ